MQPPILSGSILRDRYTVRHILGQGGMGRTYMAEDMERYNEICVLKEFIPFSSTPESVKKAKELFQREASILYQVKHPQIPEFRATFEASGRLFLVQDYVEGQTLRDILIERLDHKSTFSAAEAIELLFNVLPILSYLHQRHIIHRDISPENLMLRASDRQPVLIDFGVVKETATKLISHAPTVVGKLGYAPPEQMQSGRAYPNSDLYALAATVVVLLTGREPQELFDDVTLTWHWAQFASVSGGVKLILDKMLSFKPNDRYGSAQEVLNALDFAQASNSQAKTFVVGGRPSNFGGANLSGNNSGINISETSLNSNLASNHVNNMANVSATQKIVNPIKPKNNIGGILLGVGLVVVSGVAAWAITSMFLNSTSTNNSPISTVTPTPSLPTNINKGLEFQNNQIKVSDKITSEQTITYRLEGKKGQTLTAALTGSGLVMTLIYVDQKPIDNFSSNLTIGYWQGKLPATGAYFITIKTVSGVAESTYDLEVILKDAVVPTPKPTPIPTKTPDPVINKPEISKVVEFPPGLLSTSVEAIAKPQEPIRYNVNVLDGQTLEVAIKGNVSVEIFNPQGDMVWESSNVNPPKIKNTLSGSYQILVNSKTEAPFRLDISASE